jgi:hypothetical protein
MLADRSCWFSRLKTARRRCVPIHLRPAHAIEVPAGEWRTRARRNLGIGGRVLSLLLVLVGLPLVAAPPAHGASGDYGQVLGANQRSCPDTNCGSINWISSGSWVQAWCWRDAGSYNGTQRWFRVHYNGSDGWVSASQIGNPQPSVPYCSDLRPGEALYANESVWSANGAFRLTMQGDGNLVLYGPSGAMWASMTFGTWLWAVMQGDGNFVVYTSGGTAVWNTGTGFGGAFMVVQSDGNFVMYQGGSALWATSWHERPGGAATVSTNQGAAGNCTQYALERWHDFWAQHLYPAFRGYTDAYQFASHIIGWQVLGSPVTQSIVVFQPNVQGSGSIGHVAWVDGMQPRADGTYIHVWEMNFREADGTGGFNRVSQRWVKHVGGMSYIPAPAI